MPPSPDVTTFGRRLPPHIVDARAASGFERPYALYPRSSDPADGFHSISYSRLANAVNRMAWWIDEELSQDLGKEEDHFVYLGPNDLRYIIFILATMKTGRKILICSLRNTVDAQLSLFQRTNCKALVSCSSLATGLQALFTASENVRKIQAPTLDEVLAEDVVPHYAFEKTFEEVADERFLTLHTSGTSGNPKPISWNMKWFMQSDAGNELPTDQGPSLEESSLRHENMLSLLPCFHAAGLILSFYPIFHEMTIVLGHPDVPLSGGYIVKLLSSDIITGLLTPPSILGEISKDPAGIQTLAKLKHVGYGGGPLPPNIGKVLAPALPHLFSILGTTENGIFFSVSGGSEHWDSIRFYTGIGYNFEEVSDGVFELVIVNDSKTNKYHGIFETFPHLQEFRTGDLYSLSAPGWWRYLGRADDIIVLSNGEKINPIPLENIIASHPKIRAALVVGEYRFSPSVLVEMEDSSIPTTPEEKREALNEIWPHVQEANKVAPAFAKIPKSLILFTTREKPFIRAGKGVVQRQNNVKAYSKELDQLFSSQETDLLTEGLTLGTPLSPSVIKMFTREVYLQALETKDIKNLSDLKDSDNVFERGMDSLCVTVIVQRLRAALASCGADLNLGSIDSRLVYSAPSIGQMTEALIALVEKRNGVHAEDTSTSSQRQRRMEEILLKYSKDIPSKPASNGSVNGSAAHTKPWSVILTGTTGSLGSYLLATLESLPKSQVAKIFCLNRSADSQQRQKKLSLSRGLNASWEDGRVEFLHADFSQPDFGLGAETYARLLDEATVIIHSAWKVDFNLTIESFEPQIRGVRNFLDFSFSSKNHAPFIFVSSISTALGWLTKNPKSAVPESIIRDFDAPEDLGYGESKYVSELLVEKFTNATGITTAIFRTGQIAGPLSKSGSWNKHEWFPSILASSKHLQVLPSTLGSMETIDWIPVDRLASIMIELTETLLHKPASSQTHVYNLVNRNVTAWSSLLPSIQQPLKIPRTLPLQDWVLELEKSATENFAIDRNPAVKLLDFFRGMSAKNAQEDMKPNYEVRNLVSDSKGAAKLEMVGMEWMRLWLLQWGF